MARNSRQRPLPPLLFLATLRVLIPSSFEAASRPGRTRANAGYPRVYFLAGRYIKYLSIPGILSELSINVLVIAFDPGPRPTTRRWTARVRPPPASSEIAEVDDEISSHRHSEDM